MIKIDQLLNNLYINILSNLGKQDLKQLLSDILHERDSKLITPELMNYSKHTLRLFLEKNILLCMENKALSINKSYLKTLKSSNTKFNINILHHYFDDYIDDLKNNLINYDKKETIIELSNIYNEEINDSLKLFDIPNISSINLDHMNNLNANGRVISINNSGNVLKKGGIFLDKNSTIGYGKFINKKELLNIINNKENLGKLNISSIGIKNLKVIIKSLNQVLKVDKNKRVKNQDTRVISINDKKAGSVFLGNKGLNLPNGEYVSVEEITMALNRYINQKNSKNNSQKVIEVKNILKHTAVIATLALGAITTRVAADNNNDVIIEQNIADIDKMDYYGTTTNAFSLNQVSDNNMHNILEKTVEQVQNEIVEASVSENHISEEQPDFDLQIVSVSGNSNTVSSNDNNVNVLQRSVSENISVSANSINMEQVSDNDMKVDYVSGKEIVDYALQFVGNPYVYGGNSLTKGTDCSGFTSGIYSEFGITLPRTSEEQVKFGVDLGTDIKNALPGDLICFDGHVAIYIGDGQMVHAANSKKGITINDVDYDKPIKAIIRSNKIKNDIDTEIYKR